jgi:hypothetical protein
MSTLLSLISLSLLPWTTSAFFWQAETSFAVFPSHFCHAEDAPNSGATFLGVLDAFYAQQDTADIPEPVALGQSAFPFRLAEGVTFSHVDSAGVETLPTAVCEGHDASTIPNGHVDVLGRAYNIFEPFTVRESLEASDLGGLGTTNISAMIVAASGQGSPEAGYAVVRFDRPVSQVFLTMGRPATRICDGPDDVEAGDITRLEFTAHDEAGTLVSKLNPSIDDRFADTGFVTVSLNSDCDDMPVKEIRVWSPDFGAEDGWFVEVVAMGFVYAMPAVSAHVIVDGNISDTEFVAGVDTLEMTLAAVNSGPGPADNVTLLVVIETDAAASAIVPADSDATFIKLDENVVLASAPGAFPQRCFDGAFTYLWQVGRLEPDEELRLDIFIDISACTPHNSTLDVFASPYAFSSEQFLGICTDGICDGNGTLDTVITVPRAEDCNVAAEGIPEFATAEEQACAGSAYVRDEPFDGTPVGGCPVMKANGLCYPGCGSGDREGGRVVAEVSLQFYHNVVNESVIAGQDDMLSGNLNVTTGVVNLGPSCIPEGYLSVLFENLHFDVDGNISTFDTNSGYYMWYNNSGFRGGASPDHWTVHQSSSEDNGNHVFFNDCDDCVEFDSLNLTTPDWCTESSSYDAVSDSGSTSTTSQSSNTNDAVLSTYTLNLTLTDLGAIPCRATICYKVHREGELDDDDFVAVNTQYFADDTRAAFLAFPSQNGEYLGYGEDDGACNCVETSYLSTNDEGYFQLELIAASQVCDSNAMTLEINRFELKCLAPVERHNAGNSSDDWSAYRFPFTDDDDVRLVFSPDYELAWGVPALLPGESAELLVPYAVQNFTTVGIFQSEAVLEMTTTIFGFGADNYPYDDDDGVDADLGPDVIDPILPAVETVMAEVFREIELVLSAESLNDVVAGEPSLLTLNCPADATEPVITTSSPWSDSSDSALGSTSEDSSSYVAVTMTTEVDETGNFIHRVTMRNNGPSEATNVAVQIVLASLGDAEVDYVSSCGSGDSFYDEMDSTWYIPSLLSCQEETLTILYRANPCASVGSVSTLAVYAGSTEAPLPTDLLPGSVNFAAAATAVSRVGEVSVDVVQSAERVIAGCDSPSVNYTVTVLNDGPSCVSGVSVGVLFEPPAEGVSIVDPAGDLSATVSPAFFTTFAAVPDSTASVGTLCPGSSSMCGADIDFLPNTPAIFSFEVDVAEHAIPAFDAIVVSASLDALTEGLSSQNTTDDADSVDTDIYGRANLLITKVDSVDPVVAGAGGAGNLVHTVRVWHARDAGEPYLPAVGVVVRDRWAFTTDGITLDSVEPASDVFPLTGQRALDWEVGTLNPGDEATMNFTFTVASSAPVGHDCIINEAEITTAEFPETVSCPLLESALVSTYDDKASQETSVAREVALTFEPLVGVRTVEENLLKGVDAAGRRISELAVVGELSNAGPSDAAAIAVQVLFDLPNDAVVESVEVSAGVLTSKHPTASKETLWIVPLAQYESAKIHAVVRAYHGGRVIITAMVDEELSEETILKTEPGAIGWTVSRKLEGGRVYE